MVGVLIGMTVISCTRENEYAPKAKQLVPQKVFMFNSGDVKLLDGPFKESMDAEGKYLLSLNEDRLLSPFLKEAGLTPKDSVYKGWETNVLPGVALSFYLSGLSRLYMASGNEEYLKKINYALDELERCQKETGGYLLGTVNGIAIFERVKKEGCFQDFGHWCCGEATPFYSLEKLMSGLRDVYRVCHIKKSLDIWTGIGNWLDDLMKQIPDSELHKVMKIEYGGMNWLMADLYADTDDKRFLEISKRWQDTLTVVPCMNGIDPLTEKHANMQFPKFSGLAARYPYSGDPADLKGARFFWEQVVYYRTYATGGNSESEYFSDHDSLCKRFSPWTEENCNEYNMLRLTSLLYEIEPKAEYSDYQERILFNHSLAAQNPADCTICYFLPLMSGAHRTYGKLVDDFSCCVCSSMDHYTRHGEFIYAYDETSLYVNLFIASELNWKKKGVQLVQQTKMPFADSSVITLKCDKETDFTMKIRNPYWLASPMTLKINGEVQQPVASDGYISISRKWKSGDKINMTLPMSLRYESMKSDTGKIALFYGPVLLAGALNDQDAEAMTMNLFNPALVVDEKPINQWLASDGDSMQYVTLFSQPATLKVKPFFMLKKGYYTLYWQKMTGKEYDQREKMLAKKKQSQQELDRITVDKVVVGDSINEKAHNLSGNSWIWTVTEYATSCKGGRFFADSAGFGYTMKLPASGPATLYCKFQGRWAYERWHFDIIAGSDTIYSIKRDKNDSSPVVPFTMEFPLKPGTRGSNGKIDILFKENEKAFRGMPRLIEARIIRK